jgi:hypothetical protein
MSVTETQRRAFFDAHAAEAQAVGLFFGFPISIMLGHSGAESTFGTNTVVTSDGVDHHVFFGMSGTPAIPCRKVVVAKSPELQFNMDAKPKRFCSFDDFIDAAIGWCEFIARHPNGKNAMKHRDKPDLFLDFLAWFYRGPVSQDQHDTFVAEVKAVVKQNHVTKFDSVSMPERAALLTTYGTRLQQWITKSSAPFDGPGLAGFAGMKA